MTDQRYGAFKYGTSHKYGATSYPLSTSLSWAIEVDWDSDEIFDGVNEGAYLLKAPSIRRGRRTMLKPSGQGFEQIRTGQAVIVLSNHDGRYDGWNTSSPLYPNVESGKDIKIRVVDLNTGTVYTRFYGIIQDIVPSGYDAEAIVTIYADDTMRVLRDTQVTAQRPYTDGTVAPAKVYELMETILDSVQWPTRWGSSMFGNNYSVRYWYASGDRSAATELEDLGLSFFGYVFIANDGTFKYVDKFASQTSVLSISQDEMLKDIGNPQPWTIRRNVVKLRFHVRKRADDAIVWQPLDSDPPIESGDTNEYFIEYIYNGYQTYLENINYAILFSTSPYQVAGSLLEEYTLTDYGIRAFLSITNPNSDPAYVYAQHEQDEAFFPDNASFVRGDITWTERTDTISNPRDPSTVTNQRVLVLDSLWYQDRNQAFSFVDNYQAFISVLHKTPIIQIENRFAKQFTPDLFDIITVDIPKLGISSETFRVGAIEEDAVGENVQAVRTTFYLEPFLTKVSGAGVWVISACGSNVCKWGTAVWTW